MTAEDLLDLAPHRFDGIEIGRIGRQIEQPRAPGLEGLANSRILCVAGLSRITRSPARKAGASPCSTQAKNISPFMGPSNSQGAQGPSQRMPEISVLV